MYRLELDVHEPYAYEGRQPVGSVQILLEVRKECGQRLRRSGNESGIAGACAANPILSATNFPWLLMSAPHSTHQATMRLVHQAHGQRQPVDATQLPPGVLDRIQVVADLLHGRAKPGILLGLVLEQIDQSRLRTFNLRGDDRLLAHEGIDEPVE